MKLGSAAFALVLAFGVTGAVVACTSDEEEAKEAAAKAEADDQEQFLDTYCQILLPCCNRILAAKLDDVAGCKARLRALDPVTIANKQARADCLTQSRAATGSSFCSDFQHQKTPACPDGSRKPLVGVKKLGEACTTAAECAPAFDGLLACRAGVCQVRKRGAEGDGPCDRTVDGDIFTSSAKEGQGGTVYDCYLKDGFQCDYSQDTPTCAKPLADRAICTDSVQCLKTHFCGEDENKKRCFTRFAKDQKCEVDAQCKGRCTEKGYCSDVIGENGTCSVTSNCSDGLECVSGVCTKPGPDARLTASCQ